MTAFSNLVFSDAVGEIASRIYGRRRRLVPNLNYRVDRYCWQKKRLPIARQQGQLPAEHSFVQVQADNVVATTIKRAEHDGAVILRFYNWTGKEGDVSI